MPGKLNLDWKLSSHAVTLLHTHQSKTGCSQSRTPKTKLLWAATMIETCPWKTKLPWTARVNAPSTTTLFAAVLLAISGVVWEKFFVQQVGVRCGWLRMWSHFRRQIIREFNWKKLHKITLEKCNLFSLGTVSFYAVGWECMYFVGKLIQRRPKQCNRSTPTPWSAKQRESKVSWTAWNWARC